MDVDDEADRHGRSGADTAGAREIDRSEPRVHGNAIPLTQPVREVDRRPVDDNQIDFRMRHANRLDRVLDRGGCVGLVTEGPLPAQRRHEVVQLTVEAEPGRNHWQRPVTGSLWIAPGAGGGPEGCRGLRG
ncbi:hypothetical protein D3C83_03250 [compost metagenome]